jgi:hypothetical protein
VTGFVPNGHTQVIEETLNKICILCWQDVVTNKKESSNDLINTRFKISVKMKLSDYQKKLIEDDIQRYSQVPDEQGKPSLTLKDAMMIREISDYKLATWYLSKVYEENRRKAKADSDRAIALNGEEQRKSLEVAAEKEQEAADKKQADEIKILNLTTAAEKEKILLTGVLTIAAKGLPIPSEFQSLIQLLVPNIQMPLMMQNKQMGEAMELGAKAEMEKQQQQQVAPEEQMEQQEMQPELQEQPIQ